MCLQLSLFLTCCYATGQLLPSPATGCHDPGSHTLCLSFKSPALELASVCVRAHAPRGPGQDQTLVCSHPLEIGKCLLSS